MKKKKEINQSNEVTHNSDKTVTSTTINITKKVVQVNENADIDFEKIRWKNGIFCPWCKSTKYWLNGQSTKAQSYKCQNKKCKKTFDFMSKTFLSHSNLSLHKWSIYINCILEQLTFKQAATLTGIHIVTAWKNRIKIWKWIHQLIEEEKLNGSITLDEFFVQEAYKGNWKPENKPSRLIEKQKFYETHNKKLRGLSRFKVCLMTGTNMEGQFFFKMAGYGKLSYKRAFKALNKRLGKVHQITSDKEIAYKKYAMTYKLKHIAVKSERTGAKMLQNINSLHSQFRMFLKKFFGISYHYIQCYINWFKFLQSAKKNKLNLSGQKQVLVEQLLSF